MRHLNLFLKSRSKGWDLFSDGHAFELKSRLLYLDRKSRNMWFFISEQQYLKYKKECDKKLFWILVVAMPKRHVSSNRTKSIRESFILHREIYIVNWDVVLNFHLGNAIENSKLGAGRIMSTKKLEKMIDFDVYNLEKGRLFLPKNEGLEYLLKKG